MKNADWHEPDIPGIKYDVIEFHEDNPTKSDKPHHRLLDGWLEVIIENDGSNRFYPSGGYWGFNFLRVTDGIPVSINGKLGVKYITLTPEEEILEGFVEEDHQEVPQLGTIFGIWIRLKVKSNVRTRSVRILVTRLEQTKIL